MSTTTPGEVRSLNRWRNRPGRDLLIALAILYVAGVAYAYSLALDGDISGALFAPFVLALTLPMGILHALMVPSWVTIFALALPVALVAALIVRMPGYVRVPLLIAIAGAAIWVTWMMGIVVT
jgi:hypothetical protein